MSSIRRYSIMLSLLLTGFLGCTKTTPVGEINVDSSATLEPVAGVNVGTNDWPWWRGPNGNGIAADQSVPTTWSETRNVVWKTPVPGRGHSSPTVVADRVFLATADERAQTQSVVCFDRESGRQLWKTELHQGGFPGSSQMHGKSTHATCTLACDGARVFVAFLNHDKIFASALDFEGKQLWQRELGAFAANYGYAPSPALFKSLVIFAADNQGGGYLAALHRKTGRIVWRKSRGAVASFSSPVVATVAGKDQLLISGGKTIDSYDPNTGEPIWSVDGTAQSTCGTLVWENDLVFASGGHPQAETVAVHADGKGKVAWRISPKLYVPSMLVHRGWLYGVLDDGRVYCWNAESGQEAWRGRLGSNVSASSVLADGHIYVIDESGTCHVFLASSEKFELAASNRLGDEAFASPTICGGRIYLRVADRSSGTRREMLYCIGNAEAPTASE